MTNPHFNTTTNTNFKFETKIIQISDMKNISDQLKEAVELLQSNELVAFPTETVYGLGANAFEENAVKKIFQAKGRPADNPIIVHVSSYEMFQEVTAVKHNKEEIKRLQECFWPGPLTLIVQKSDKVPYVTTGELETVAVRMPVHPMALALIKESNLPIAAPSANISGKPSPTTALDVFEDMQGKISLILDGGMCEIGLESTVLDMSDPTRKPIILRPGKVTKQQIERCLGKEIDILNVADVTENKTPIKARSPGMKYRHYAPKADVILTRSIGEFLASYNDSKLKYQAIGLIYDAKYGTTVVENGIKVPEELTYTYQTIEQFGSNLYFKLRELDNKRVSLIIIQFSDSDGFGEAILNRLQKASSKK